MSGAAGRIWHGPATLRPKRAAHNAAPGSAPLGHAKFECGLLHQGDKVGEHRLHKNADTTLTPARF